MKQIERYKGGLLGLAVGDALGTTLEFKHAGSFTPIADMIGGGPFGLLPGQWTDDTSMALCLAESLIEKHGFDPIDQLTKYLRWYENGYLSSKERCFDIGQTVRAALVRFKKTHEPYCGSSDSRSAGNGSLMRLVPVPLFYSNNPREAIEKSGSSSKTTHLHPAAVDACRYFAGILTGAMAGLNKEDLMSSRFCPLFKYWTLNPLVPEIDEVARGSFKSRSPPEIQGTGYVVKSLEAALWAFYNSNSFKEGCLMAVNLGDDADTTGAIYGQLAGMYYGENEIPKAWRLTLAHLQKIEQVSERLYSISKSNVN